MQTITLKKGLKKNLPTHAPLGEPLFCVDTHELYIGLGSEENIVKITDSNLVKEVAELKLQLLSFERELKTLRKGDYTNGLQKEKN